MLKLISVSFLAFPHSPEREFRDKLRTSGQIKMTVRNCTLWMGRAPGLRDVDEVYDGRLE